MKEYYVAFAYSKNGYEYIALDVNYDFYQSEKSICKELLIELMAHLTYKYHLTYVTILNIFEIQSDKKDNT